MKKKYVRVEISARMDENRKHEKFEVEYKIPIDAKDEHYGIMNFIQEHGDLTLRELADIADGVDRFEELEDPCEKHSG